MLKAHVHPNRFARLFFCFGMVHSCSVLIGYYFPSDNFQLREIPAMHLGRQWAFNKACQVIEVSLICKTIVILCLFRKEHGIQVAWKAFVCAPPH